uniref:CCHC-type domain-containing protein n=1 Tax=Strongyloides venezuelensis TaxID=75913 RepID=A0A0K0FBA1_STRVS
MPDYNGKVKMFEDVSEDIGPWLNRLGRAMILQKTVEEEKVLVLMTLDRYDGQLARSTIKSKLKNFKVDPMTPKFEEQLRELAELVRKSQPNASEEAIVEAQCNRIEREIEEWDTLWNKATSQEWRSSSELISALVSTNDHFKRKKERGLLRKKVSGIHIRHDNHFGKQHDEKDKVRNVPLCFGCGEQGHKRYECPKKGKVEPFIQSKLCEIKDVKEKPKLEYVEPMNLDERLKLILLNRSEMKDLGEDVTLPVLVKCTNDSQCGYKSSLALIDGGANKTSITYNLAEAMGWKVDELDEVKVGLAGNVEGTLKKGHQMKLMPIQGGFDVELWVCVETTRRKDERYGITLGSDFLDMKRVTVHHGQNKMTIGDKLYHGITIDKRKKLKEVLIPTHSTVFGEDNEPCVIEVPKFQFSAKEVLKHSLFSVKPEMREAVQEQIESWKSQRIVAPCLWPHSVLNLIAAPKPSPVNKHGIRVCLDARPINQITCRSLKLWKTLYDKENNENNSIEETIGVVNEEVVSKKIKEIPEVVKKVFRKYHDQLDHPSYERSFIMIDRELVKVGKSISRKKIRKIDRELLKQCEICSRLRKRPKDKEKNLERQNEIEKARRVSYEILKALQESPTTIEGEFRIGQNVRMKEAARNQTKFEPPQIYVITEVKSPYVYLKVEGTKGRPLKRHMKDVVLVY